MPACFLKEPSLAIQRLLYTTSSQARAQGNTVSPMISAHGKDSVLPPAARQAHAEAAEGGERATPVLTPCLAWGKSLFKSLKIH